MKNWIRCAPLTEREFWSAGLPGLLDVEMGFSGPTTPSSNLRAIPSQLAPTDAYSQRGTTGTKRTNVPYVPMGVAGTRDKRDKAPRRRLSLSRPAVRPADGRPRSPSSVPELRLATLAQPYPTALSALDISEQGVNAQTREINQLGCPRLRKLSRGGCVPGHDLPLE
jgi:hypothetical protein